MNPLSWRDLFASPANFFALGFGLGLAPKAPGTFGTLLGVPLFLLMPQSILVYVVILVVLFFFGVWCCGQSAKDLGVHDHPGIVWDEVVGYLLAMITLPAEPLWMCAGFVVFRFFDIVKPWPIGWVDKQVHGGMGIMLDDVLAAVYSLIVLQLAYRFVSLSVA
ncbi:MAG: phosphatidylglycerophosphatase A [Granulosicoccus sp.]